MLVVKPENVGLQIVDAFDLTYASRPRFSLVDCLRKSCQFLFSQVGLCGLVVLYAFVGGIVFQHLEQTNEIHECQTRASKYGKLENETLKQLWVIADHLRSREEAVDAFRMQLADFRTFLFQIGGGGMSDCAERESKGDWTFPDAMLFAVTVFTTIGYGNVAPRTFWGRLVCICYSMLGIPLMLLCLGNLAAVLGNAFRYVYSQMLCCGCCLPRRLSSRGTRRSTIPGVGVGTSGGSSSNPLTPEQWMRNYEKDRAATDSQQRLDLDVKGPDVEKQKEAADQLERKREEMEAEMERQHMEDGLESDGYERKKNKAIDSKASAPAEEDWTGGSDTDGRKTVGMRPDEENRERAGTDGRGTSGRKADGWPDGRTSTTADGGRQHQGDRTNGKCAEENMEGDVESEAGDAEERVGIPLTISLAIIAGYLLFGAVLYGVWETEWSALDSAYYCFVTISTIGFGDLVPGSAGFQTEGDGWRMVSASLYMLIGMALLSMCFNLMQDQIAEKCRRLGQIIGLLDKK